MKNHNLLEYEKVYWNKNEAVAGIDEAGRGPIFGPLVVALVSFPINYSNDEIYDSKALSHKKRKKLFHQIINDCIYYDFEVVSTKTIDELNIYVATKKAMEKLATNTKTKIILTDAMKIDVRKESVAIIKGDQKSISIAAASIVAKVIRDQIMEHSSILYPNYEFEKHKGYPTKRHFEIIEKYAILDDYRKSYGPVKNKLGK